MERTQNQREGLVLVHGRPDSDLRRSLGRAGYELDAIVGATTVWTVIRRRDRDAWPEPKDKGGFLAVSNGGWR